MNTNSRLTLLALVAAVSAFALAPFNLGLSLTALFATGLVGLLVGDYARSARSLRPATAAVAAGRTERLGLAA